MSASFLFDTATPPMPVLLSPKRGTNERAGIHCWFPYYAGFSEDFVRSALAFLDVKAGQLVLDPMNGSGTTTLGCLRAGVQSIGLDRNPVMVIFSSAKDPRFLDLRVAEMAQRHVSLAGDSLRESEVPATDSRWFKPDVLWTLRTLRRIIEETVHDGQEGWEDHLPEVTQLPQAGRTINSFHMAALLRTARYFSSARASKNPTWLKSGGAESVNGSEILDRYLQLVREMRSDLSLAFAGVAVGTPVRTQEADATQLLGVRDGSIDAIITSPPYLTRIEYAMSTAPELEVLEASGARVDDLRRRLMGTTCINQRSAVDPHPNWGMAVGKLLGEIRKHPSKASSGYYYKNAWQYFDNAHRFLQSCLRVLRPGGRALIVVQDSWYKEVPVRLGELYVDMARTQSSDAHIESSFEVSSHLGMLNKGARMYPKGSVSEHVVLIRKREEAP